MLKSELRPPRGTGVRADVERSTASENLVTILASLWLVIGLFLDGFAHERVLDGNESFLTPWHAVFYFGFAANVASVGWMARRRRGSGRWRDALPTGYGSVPTGLGVFALGGVGDALWHARFGVETGIDALLSPTHLLLFAGLVVILGAPFRAARSATVSGSGSGSWSWRGSWAALGSLVLTTALVGFFVNFVWGLGTDALTRVAYDPVTQVGEDQVVAAVASSLVSTAVLFGSALFLLRRGPAPPGAFTLLFGLVALLVAVAFEEGGAGVAAALVGGAVLDALLRARSGGSPWPTVVGRAFIASPAAMWLAYFLLVRLDGGITWQPELWLGSVVLNGLAGYGLFRLVFADPAGTRGSSRSPAPGAAERTEGGR